MAQRIRTSVQGDIVYSIGDTTRDSRSTNSQPHATKTTFHVQLLEKHSVQMDLPRSAACAEWGYQWVAYIGAD